MHHRIGGAWSKDCERRVPTKGLVAVNPASNALRCENETPHAALQDVEPLAAEIGARLDGMPSVRPAPILSPLIDFRR